MSWLRSNQRSAWIIGLTLLIPVLIYLNVLLGLLSLRQGYQAEIDTLAPRIARLQGLIEYEDQLRDSALEVDKQMVNMVYPATEGSAAASTRLQKNVRQIFVEVGLSVSNSQVLPIREKNAFDYIGLKLTVTGDVAALDAAMIAIAGYTPLLLVESLDVWPARGSSRQGKTGVQTISASLQLLSLRAVQ
jgi:general secretion pathway protein M